MAATPDSRHITPDTPSRRPVADARTEALRDPLAAILGHAQYLKQCYLSGTPVSPDAYLWALATIERSVWAVEGHLRVIEDEQAASDAGQG